MTTSAPFAHYRDAAIFAVAKQDAGYAVSLPKRRRGQYYVTYMTPKRGPVKLRLGENTRSYGNTR